MKLITGIVISTIFLGWFLAVSLFDTVVLGRSATQQEEPESWGGE